MEGSFPQIAKIEAEAVGPHCLSLIENSLILLMLVEDLLQWGHAVIWFVSEFSYVEILYI
jgi:hypothetical protein